MRFTARWSPQEPGTLEAKIWLEDASNMAFRFSLPENSIQAWKKGLQKLSEAEKSDLGRALAASSRVSFLYPPIGPSVTSAADVDRGALLERLAFCKFVLAWKRLSPKSPVSMLNFLKDPSMSELRRLWPYNWFFLEMVSDKSPYNWWFLQGRGDGDNRSLILMREDFLGELDKQIEQIRDKKEFILVHIISNLDLLYAMQMERPREEPERAQMIRQTSVALMLAFLDFAENVKDKRLFDSAGIVLHYRPDFCARLAGSKALPLSERLSFLKRLFSANIMESTRRPLIYEILEDLAEESKSDPQSHYSMETIASFIAQTYLERYMLDDALRVWQKIQQVTQDTLLQIILGLYRAPQVYFWLGLLLIWLLCADFLPDWGGVTIGVIGLLFLHSLALFMMAFAAWRFLQKRGFSSIELFLPRLAGAVLVGLSILVLENTIWEVSAQLPVLSSFFVSIAGYLGALTYIFLDVHKTIRLLSIEENTATNHVNSLPSTSTPSAQSNSLVFSVTNFYRRLTSNRQISPSMARSVSTSWRFFAIGAAEALGLTTLVSSLFLLPEKLFTRSSVFWQRAGWRILQGFEPWGVVFYGPGIRLVFSPKIIILWAGLALLLGAFAQLLWQDRQITAS